MMKLKGKSVPTGYRELRQDPAANTLVFVYGTLKRGYGNNRLLRDGDARFIGEASTLFPYFRLYGRGIPFMALERDESRGLNVKGEVWEVDPNCLQRLDWLEGHPHMYTRQTIEVLTDEGPCQAEAYLYLHPVSEDMDDLRDEYRGYVGGRTRYGARRDG